MDGRCAIGGGKSQARWGGASQLCEQVVSSGERNLALTEVIFLVLPLTRRML